MLETTFYDYLAPALNKAVAGRGIDPDWVVALVDSAAELPEGERERVMLDGLAELSALAQMPDMGFAVAEGIPITAFGVVTLGLPVAPTLGDMLGVLRRFQRLIARPLLVDLATDGDDAVIVVAMEGLTGSGFDQLVCGSLLLIDRHLGNYTGKPHNFTRVELMTPLQEIGVAAHRYLGAEVDIECQRVAAHFPSAYLALSSPTADPATFQGILQLCEQAEQALGRVPDIPTRVREIISANIADPPDLPNLARRLAVTERQLRFALTRAGTSYQNIVRDARVAQAHAMLRNADLPISAIAYRLGYNDPANFSSAFKKWTGQSPRDMRVSFKEADNET